MSAKKVCAECGKEAETMSRCALCKEAFYCDTECQQVNWKIHRKMCYPYEKSNYNILYRKLLETAANLELGIDETHVLMDTTSIFVYKVDDAKFESMDTSDFNFRKGGAIRALALDKIDAECAKCKHETKESKSGCMFEDLREHAQKCEKKSRGLCVCITFFVGQKGAANCYIHIPRTISLQKESEKE
jgi:hypothetical protein